MKRILLVATGGTIASKKSQNGLKPQITPEELISYVPDVKNICDVDTYQLFNLDSTNIEPKHWVMIAQFIKERYEKYDGFVITHGTDTMAYTAAALSYMIQNSHKPIVITGSQKPIDLDITDAKTNLIDSFTYAADDDSQGIQIVFDGKVIAGTRAKKVRSKSYNAFSSIDFPSLAVIQGSHIMRYIPMLPYEKNVQFYTNMNSKVFLLKLVPGVRSEFLRFLFESNDALIVESFGVGGIPSTIREEFFNLCKEYPEKMVVISTQVAHEGSDMTVYEVGHEIKNAGHILESYDMTLESVVAKIMWILSNIDKKDHEKMFYEKINYDLVFDINH